MHKILILNGPNLDRLGKREPEVYGDQTLDDLQNELTRFAGETRLEFYQSNHEGALIDRIAAAADSGLDGLIFNPGGFTHTSVALRDAIAGSGLPTVEVHISNIYQRESFRQHSYTAGACLGVMSGFGFSGYRYALDYLVNRLKNPAK